MPSTRSKTLGMIAATAALLSIAVSAPAFAASDKSAVIVMDANSGKTLLAQNADALRYPASLTKMMTLYVLFEDLSAKRFTLNSLLTVSANAAAQPPSKLGLRPGATIRVEDAILALTTRSANDMAITVAENVAGSVPAFAARMNRAARALGMSSTTYHNPNGLPDPGQMTTARDLVKLGRALQDRFPAYYRYFGVKSFVYAGRRISNHNHLLGSVQGVDGIKTGYTRASGFNLVTSVNRDGRHLIAVVMGGRTAASRDGQMRQLIARYLPVASRGAPSPSVEVADLGEATAAASTDTESDGDEDGASTEASAQGSRAAAVPQPRPDTGPQPRPQPSTSVAAAGPAPDALAYTPTPRPAVTGSTAAAAAAIARAASRLPGSPKRVIAQGDTSDAADDVPADAIAQRISTATEVAELAFAETEARGDDPIARLTAVARVKAGEQHAQLAAAAGGVPDAASWHIQIGAFPTAEGAQASLDKAKSSIGPGLPVRPVLQPVVQNGGTIYRARFAGFTDKEQARAACARLQLASIKCLAVPN